LVKYEANLKEQFDNLSTL